MILYVEFPDKREEGEKLIDLLLKYEIRGNTFSLDNYRGWIELKGMSFVLGSAVIPPIDAEDYPSLYTVVSKKHFTTNLILIEEWLKIFQASYYDLKDMIAGSFKIKTILKPINRQEHKLVTKLCGIDGKTIIEEISIIAKNGFDQYITKS